MSSRSEIVRLLSDGCFHSGTDIGRELGVSRAAVCKAVKHLASTGLAVHRIPGRGYRLPVPLSLLDAGAIREILGTHPAARLSFDVLDEVDSTNAHLLRAGRAGAETAGAVCLAEAQKAGRGRRGRQWVATPYRNVMMSVGWRFEEGPGALAGLSLAAGVAIAEALSAFGIPDIRLKWPNDVLWRNRKLGGLLIEMQGEAAGPTLIVLGIGVNIHIDAADAALIDQPWTDIVSITGAVPDRNRLVAVLLLHVVDMLTAFAVSGFGGFRERWQQFDAFAGKSVRIFLGDSTYDGLARGIDADGGVVVEGPGGARVFHAGEITLRGL